MRSKAFRVLIFQIFLPLLLAGFACSGAYALDTVLLDRPQSILDTRKDYPALLIKEVLNRTKKQYGPYVINLAPYYMERQRQLTEMERGQMVNVIASPSQTSWEEKLIPIRIPVDMGLQSWRLALINRENQARFRAVETTDQIRQLSVGVGPGWASYGILTSANFNVVAGGNFDGMFDMLRRGRFDYFLRGVNEVFPELDPRQAGYPNLVLDDSFMVHMPLPWLFFVSPKTPRLAQRITVGMEAMVKDGSLRRFMLQHHKEFLVRAQLCKRRVFEVKNANVSAEFLARKELWFNPLDPANGICPRQKTPGHDSNLP